MLEPEAGDARGEIHVLDDLASDQRAVGNLGARRLDDPGNAGMFLAKLAIDDQSAKTKNNNNGNQQAFDHERVR